MKSIAELAREAGLYTHKEVQPELQHFASLVIEQKHKQLLEGSGEPIVLTESNDGTPTAYTADQLAAAVLRERERCAKLCDAEAENGANAYNWSRSYTAEDIAAAIRGQE